MAPSRIPFKRVTQAFDEMARARLYESSGSEHSAENSAELSDLVNSFIERGEEDEDYNSAPSENNNDSDIETSYESNNKDLLLLLGYVKGISDVKEMIRSETELGMGSGMTSSSQGFKRHLMSRLRERGLDAGLCKSKWKKLGQFPAGDYEYIDVILKGNRYIVQVNLVGEFTIARPITHYQSLLDAFPQIYVGEPDDLKQIVKLMCSALKKSMKTSDMNVPPWRRNGYMLAKWFGSYKRTTDAVAKTNVSNFREGLSKKRSVGFETSPVGLHYCRVEMGRKSNLRVGNLAQLLGATK